MKWHWIFLSALGASLLGLSLRGDTLLSTTAFNYTGASQSYTVPAGANRVVIKAWGGGGGGGFYSAGGGAGFISATYNSIPGQVYTVMVGGAGGAVQTGGYNGGGNGGAAAAGGGGGATRVYLSGGFDVWAGGAGGGGQIYGVGGVGGGLYGGGAGTGGVPGGGGTATAGGAGGANATAGSFGTGGTGANTTGYPGGGGGGGYYGGGGGGDGVAGVGGAGGGGGSTIATGSPISASPIAGGGQTPGGTGDANYPGNNRGYGAVFGLYNGGYPGYAVILAYQVDALPLISLSGQVNYNQRQAVSYSGWATGSPTISSYAATGLPPGVSINTTTGVISGNTTTAGTYNSTLSATNSLGTSNSSVTWVVTSASITGNASVSPGVAQLSQSVQIYRDGSANFGIAYTETVVWKPGGGYDYLGVAAASGSFTYTPPTTVGTYTIQFRVVDTYFNYVDQTLTFDVAPPVQSLPYTTGFELSESYNPGSLHAQQGWLVPLGSAQVSTEQAQQGSYGVKLVPGSQLADVKKYFSTASNWAFVDVYVRPISTSSVQDSSVLDYGSSRIGFVSTGGQGAIYLYDGNGSGSGTWIDSGQRFPVDGSGQSTGWIRLTVRHDYATHTWDAYANGTLIDYDLGMVANIATSFTDLNWWGHPTAVAYFDQFTASTTNPVFTDADHDGMADSWETAHGLNPASNDRSTDADGDGRPNILEYFEGSHPTSSDITPPTTPTSFQVTALGTGNVSLSWNASTDAGSGLLGYHVYRNGAKLTVSLLTSPAFSDTGLTAGTTYTYTVRAVDVAGNLSAASTPLILSTTAASTSGSFELLTPAP